jgi:DNA-binding NarL/FixJ family response regulator
MQRLVSFQAMLEAPDGLECGHFELGGEEFMVLSFPEARPDTSSLTRAEEDILGEVLRGFTNREIALRRRRSLRTIANQVAAVLRKMGGNSRYDLVAKLAARQRSMP